MFCTKCGAELLDGAKFCTGCGAPVPGASDDLPKTEVVPQKEPEPSSEPQENQNETPSCAEEAAENPEPIGLEKEDLSVVSSAVPSAQISKKKSKRVWMAIFAVAVVALLGVLIAYIVQESSASEMYDEVCAVIDEYGQNGTLTIYNSVYPDEIITIKDSQAGIAVSYEKDGTEQFINVYPEYEVKKYGFEMLTKDTLKVIYLDEDGIDFSVGSTVNNLMEVFINFKDEYAVVQGISDTTYLWVIKGYGDVEPNPPTVNNTVSDYDRFIDKLQSSYWISEYGDILYTGWSEYGLNVQQFSAFTQDIGFNGYIDDYAESGYNDGKFYIAFYADPDEYGDSNHVMIRDEETSGGICVFEMDYKYGTLYEPYYD